MKKLLIIVLVVLLSLSIIGCTAEKAAPQEESSAKEDTAAAKDDAPATEEDAADEGEAAGDDAVQEKKVIGFIIAGPDHYYQTNYDTFTKASEPDGWEVLFLNSEWSFEKELANVEDLIQKKVDAIVLQTLNAEAVLEACKKSLDAGIPFYLIAGSAAPSDTPPTCVVEGNWYIAGVNAANVINETYPDGAKVALIGGVTAAVVDGEITKGFEETVAELGADIEIVFNQPGDWQREKAMNVMQDLIAAKVAYDVVFVYNEDMADGALQVMKEANAQKPIITNNGKDLGQKMVKDGDVIATTEFAPTKEGYLMYLAVKANFEGKTVAQNIPNAGLLLTIDNIDEAIPWDVNKFFNEYLNVIWDPQEEIAPYIQ